MKKDGEEEDGLGEGVGDDEDGEAASAESFAHGVHEEGPADSGGEADDDAEGGEGVFFHAAAGGVDEDDEDGHHDDHGAGGEEEREPESAPVEFGRRGRHAGDVWLGNGIVHRDSLGENGARVRGKVGDLFWVELLRLEVLDWRGFGGGCSSRSPLFFFSF